MYKGCRENASIKDKVNDDGDYLIIIEDGYTLCYSIDGIGESNLTLFYEGAGRFLTYKRIK